MATNTFNRDEKRVEVLNHLSQIRPSLPQYLQVSVSFNAPLDEAVAEVKSLEKLGYLVVSTYGDDWDCGQILRYALGKEKDEVVEEHLTQLIKSQWSPAIRNGDELLIVEDGNVYEAHNYNYNRNNR